MPLIRGQPSWLVFAGAVAAGIRPAARRIGRSLRIALLFGRFGIAMLVPGRRGAKTGRPRALRVRRRAARSGRRAVAVRGPPERQRATSRRLSKTALSVRP